MELNQLAIDYEKSTKGIWVDFTKEVKFLIAKKPNPKFDEELAKLIEPFLASIAAGTFDDVLDKLITAKATAKTVLLGWEGITVDGEPYEYSYENALEMLTNKNYTDVYRFVLTIAHSAERYRVHNIEEAEKN
jgi:hypothetical protein